MSKRSIAWTSGLAALTLAGAVAGVAAQQQVMTQTTDTIRIGPGGLTLGPSQPDRPLAAGTGLVVGQTIDAASKRPVSDAVVTLSLPGYLPARVLADPDGRFVFRELPAGRFTLTATRPGYADGGFGRLRPGGPTQSIDLAADQKLGDVTLAMWKFAAVGGTVLDENGDPLVGAQVSVLRQAFVAGKRQLQPAEDATTDDRGSYRVGALVPGEYIVALPMTPSEPDGPLAQLVQRAAGLAAGTAARVSADGGGGGRGGTVFSLQTVDSLSPSDATTAGLTDDGHILAYPTTFFPTAGSPARATAVTLASGDEQLGLDFQLRPVRTAKVSGIVTGPDGPVASLSVTLTPSDYEDLVTAIGAPTALTDGTGRFTFAGVTPGSYVLRAVKSPGLTGDVNITRTANGGMMMTMTRMVVNANGAPPPLPTDATLWSETAVPVGNGDVTDLSIALHPAIRANGTVAFDGGTAKPTPDQLGAISVSLEAADGRTAVDGGSARGRVDPNGTFQTMGVPPGNYIVRVSGAPKGWTFAGAMMGGRDVSIEPIEFASGDVSGIALTFTDHPASFGGNVTTSNGAADPGATVLVFPTDPGEWVGHGASPRCIRTARVGTDGTFTIASLPPGHYFAAAVSEATAPDANPKFLELLARSATRVDVNDGEQKKQTLQTVTPGVR